MTDPKDELRARFDDQASTDDRDDDSAEDAREDDTNTTSNSDGIDNTNNSSNTGNPNNTSNSGNAGASTSSDTSDTDQTATTATPGPEKDATATRHRRQVPMYLPEAKATALNQLYERLDGRSKVAGEGGIEKHADFMEQLVEFAIEHEDDLAAELDIQ